MTDQQQQTATDQVTDVIFILDKSGSMETCRQAAIDGFNEQVDNLRKNASMPGVGKIYVTLITFSDHSHVVLDRVSLDNLHKLTPEDYVPDGSTAWLNAVHLGVARAKALPDYNSPTHAFLMQSVTDGGENHSHHVKPHATWESTAQLVKECQDTNRWTFSVIGANIDLSVVAQRTGIPMGNAASYSSTPSGTAAATTTASAANDSYFEMRSRGLTSSESYMADATGGTGVIDDPDAPGGQTPPFPYQPTNPPQPVPSTPQNQARTRHEGSMLGGTTSGARSPLLSGEGD